MTECPPATSASFLYLDMVREFNQAPPSSPDGEIRLALLGDFATQQLAPLLHVLFRRKNLALQLYEAPYDTIEPEVLNPCSALYAFRPDYIALLPTSQHLKAKFYASENRKAFAGETIERWKNVWAAIAAHCGSATILQGNYVTPSERAYGHYERKVATSAGSIFAEINYGLSLAIRATRQVLPCDIDHLAGEAGRRAWCDERLWSIAKTFCHPDQLPHLAKAVCDIILAARGQVTKCVVLDLDNTLWGGVIGDDGLNGIALGGYDEGESFVTFQSFLKELKRRGILLAVVSKNEAANAVLPFREHREMVLTEEDISVFIANWNNKADNIRQVQRILNIGFDSIVFLDDSPFERALVRDYLPDMIVPELPGDDPALFLRVLTDLALFETASHSETDVNRTEQYRQEAQRTLARESFSTIAEYLRSLDMTARLERFTPQNVPRIAQLIQRSNQFNLTTRRYSASACAALMNDPATIPFTLTLADRFGDYGLISVIILKTLPIRLSPTHTTYCMLPLSRVKLPEGGRDRIASDSEE